MIMSAIMGAAILVILIYASYVDIKNKEIPDWISYVTAIISIISLIYFPSSLFLKDRLLAAIVVAAIVFIVSYLMYIAGLWGGGDTKLFTALSIYLSNYGYFAIALFFFIMAVSAIIYNNAVSLLFLPKLMKKRKINPVVIGFSLIAIIACLMMKFWIPSLIALFIFDYYYLKLVEKHIMIIHKRTNELVEGDWLVSEIKGVPKRNIGLTIEDIEKIKAKRIDHVLVKDGFAFIPVIAIAFIIFIVMAYYNMTGIEFLYNLLGHSY